MWRPDERLTERFWRFVPDRPEEGCWIFYGCRDKRGGYGRFQVGHGKSPRVERAHRVAWVLAGNRLPRGKKRLLTLCDEPACVRPDHHEVGTQRDRLRGNEGEDSPTAKLSDDEVRRVRFAAAAGMPQRKIARALRISDAQVSNLVRGRQRLAAGGPVRP